VLQLGLPANATLLRISAPPTFSKAHLTPHFLFCLFGDRVVKKNGQLRVPAPPPVSRLPFHSSRRDIGRRSMLSLITCEQHQISIDTQRHSDYFWCNSLISFVTCICRLNTSIKCANHPQQALLMRKSEASLTELMAQLAAAGRV
jgi:hypothetical protein